MLQTIRPALLFIILCIGLPAAAQDLKILFPEQHSTELGTPRVFIPKDSSKVITYGDNAPLVWDVRTGAAILKLTGHNAAVTKIIEADGFFTMGGNKIIRWDKQFKKLAEYTNENGGFADFDYAYPYIVGTGWLFSRTWDVRTGKLVQTVQHGHSSHGKKIKIRPGTNSVFLLKTNYSGSSILASDGDTENHEHDSALVSWKIGQDGLVKFPAEGVIDQFDFSKSGKRLLVLCSNGMMGVYDMMQGGIKARSAILSSLLPERKSMTVDNATYGYTINSTADIAAIEKDTECVLYDLEKDKLIPADGLLKPFKENTTKFKGNLLIAKYWEGDDLVWVGYDFTRGKRLELKAERIGHGANHYIEAYSDGNLVLLNASDGEQLLTVYEAPQRLRQTYLTGNDQLLLVSPYTVSSLNLQTLKLSSSFAHLEQYREPGMKLYPAADGTIMKSAFAGGGLARIHPNLEVDKFTGDHLVKSLYAGNDNKGKYMLALNGDTVKVLSASSGALHTYHIQEKGINHFFGKTRIGELGDPLRDFERLVSPVVISGDGNAFAVSVTDSLLEFKNVQTGQLKSSTIIPGASKYSELALMKFVSNDSLFVYVTTAGDLFIIDAFTGVITDSVDIENMYIDVIDLVELPGRKLFWVTDVGQCYIYDIATGNVVVSVDAGTPLFSLSDRKNYFITWSGDVLTVWDIATGLSEKTFVTSLDDIANVFLRENEQQLIVVSSRMQLKIYDFEKEGSAQGFTTDDAKLNITLQGGTAVIAWDKDNYYMANKSKVDKIVFQGKQGNIYSFEQFDHIYNRPDIILKKLGCRDTALISAYHTAWKKRLQKLNIKETNIKGAVPPTLRIANRNTIPVSTANGNMKLSINASDAGKQLSRLFASVNGVPLYGSKGIPVRQSFTDTSLTIALSAGDNKVEVYCINKAGLESWRERINVHYKPAVPVQPKLYFIGIGVNQYREPGHELYYAVKDIRDLASVFKEKHPESIIDTLMNEHATAANILALRTKLQRTTPEDKVIIAFSGHGLLDPQFNFYCATWDVSFNTPQKDGLLYEDLLSLLDDIPSRKKLIMIDACHSGDMDKADASFSNGTDTTQGRKGLTIVKSKTEKAHNSYDLMKSVFADLTKGNGATVISASGGKEYALEDKTYDNGIFTWCVKKFLLQTPAGYSDRKSVNQLKDFVSSEVERITGGRQKPTSRKDNLQNDWVLW